MWEGENILLKYPINFWGWEERKREEKRTKKKSKMEEKNKI